MTTALRTENLRKVDASLTKVFTLLFRRRVNAHWNAGRARFHAPHSVDLPPRRLRIFKPFAFRRSIDFDDLDIEREAPDDFHEYREIT